MLIEDNSRIMRKKYLILGRNYEHKLWSLEYQTCTAIGATILMWYANLKYDVVEMRRV